MVRECSEEIEEKIETLMIWEVVELIYRDKRLWSSFKPMVENPFQFKPVTDQDIIDFLDTDLPKQYEPQH